MRKLVARGVGGAEAALDIEGKWGSERNVAWSRRFAGWEAAEPFPMSNGRDARCPGARFADEGMNVIFNEGLNVWEEPVKKGVWCGGRVRLRQPHCTRGFAAVHGVQPAAFRRDWDGMVLLGLHRFAFRHFEFASPGCKVRGLARGEARPQDAGTSSQSLIPREDLVKYMRHLN